MKQTTSMPFSQKLEGTILHIQTELTTNHIDQLVSYAQNDELVREFSSDKERFADHTAVQKWLQKKRSIYILTDQNQVLHGIIWFGVKQPPSDDKAFESHDLTFAIRMYGSARGKRLALPFMEHAFEAFKQTNEFKKSHSGKFWLVTKSTNARAQSLYKKFGFRLIPFGSGDSIAMILD